MGAKFHISPRTNRTERCQAGDGENSRGCLYGNGSPHFSSREEANAYIEEKAAQENSEIPKAVGDSGSSRGGSRRLDPLTPEQVEKCLKIVDPKEGRRISDSIAMLKNPDRGWALEKMDSNSSVAKLVLNYAHHYERVEEAARRRANIEWRGRHAKTEEQRESYRNQWRSVNRELGEANVDFQRVREERDQALRYFESCKKSRERIQSVTNKHYEEGNFSYRRYSKEEAREIAERSNLYKALQEKIDKGDDSSLNAAANIHGSQHLIRDIKGYTDYRRASKASEKTVSELTKRIASTENPAEKRHLMNLRSKEEERKIKSDDMMGKFSKSYETLVNEIRNGNQECEEALALMLKKRRTSSVNY